MPDKPSCNVPQATLLPNVVLATAELATLDSFGAAAALPSNAAALSPEVTLDLRDYRCAVVVRFERFAIRREVIDVSITRRALQGFEEDPTLDTREAVFAYARQRLAEYDAALDDRSEAGLASIQHAGWAPLEARSACAVFIDSQRAFAATPAVGVQLGTWLVAVRTDPETGSKSYHPITGALTPAPESDHATRKRIAAALAAARAAFAAALSDTSGNV